MIFGKSMTEQSTRRAAIDAWWRQNEGKSVARRFAFLPTFLEDGRIIWLSFYDEWVVPVSEPARISNLQYWRTCEVTEWHHPEFRIARYVGHPDLKPKKSSENPCEPPLHPA